MKYLYKTDNTFREKMAQKGRDSLEKARREWKVVYDSFKGKYHSNESKEIISKKVKDWIKETGGSSLGRIWICNHCLNSNKMIYPEELELFLRNWWVKGKIFSESAKESLQKWIYSTKIIKSWKENPLWWKIWICKKEESLEKMITKEDFENYEKEWWERGVLREMKQEDKDSLSKKLKEKYKTVKNKNFWKISIFKEEGKEIKIVFEEEFEQYKQLGFEKWKAPWVPNNFSKKGTFANKDRIKMINPNCNNFKFVKKEEIEELLKEGWELCKKRVKKEVWTRYKIWITNKELNKTSMINPEDLNQFESEGWIKWRLL